MDSLETAQFESILASVRHCSKFDFWQRFQFIDSLVQQQTPASLIQAAEHMERLNDRLQSFSRRTHRDAYDRARHHLLLTWRHVMRGDYDAARQHLASASACCGDMA